MSPTTRHRSLQVLAVLALLAAGPAGADTYLVDSWITGNTSDTASAISSTSLLLVDRSTISDNSGGASIWLYGMFSTLRNTTVSGNLHLASEGGFGVAVYGVSIDGCTLAGNSGSQLFGIGYSTPWSAVVW